LTEPLRLPESAPPAARERLESLIGLIAADPSTPSSVRDPAEARRIHIADSLSGLDMAPLAAAQRIADVGAGAGFPGLVLAIVMPDAQVDLIESIGRKCEFMRTLTARLEITNAAVICDRAETVGAAPPPAGGREAYDAVTARAVGRLATLAELASPLLRHDGVLVAWKGARNPDEEAELERASSRLAMRGERVAASGPYSGSRNRHLFLLRKFGPTPDDLPRRPGMAKKRPLGSTRG
jgi:16S rRNA (guanine527-N7)-methyltransferase